MSFLVRCLIVLVFFTNTVIANEPLCSCYKWYDYRIRTIIDDYNVVAKRRFHYELPPYREKWEKKYYDCYKEIDRQTPRSYPMRYTDAYKFFLINGQKIDIIKDFWFDLWYELYNPKHELISEKRKNSGQYYSICKEKLDECLNKITNEYIKLFEECIKEHNCLATYHDYGLLAYLNNNFDKSIEMLSKMIEVAENTGQIETLESQIYHDLGSVCIETLMYDKAIRFLSEAISKDPSNKAVYFDRAVAYFETGSYDLALQDYMMSKDALISKPDSQVPVEFKEALLNGLIDGP